MTAVKAARSVAVVAALGVAGASAMSQHTATEHVVAAAPIANSERDPQPLPTVPTTTTTTSVAPHIEPPRATRSYVRPGITSAPKNLRDRIGNCESKDYTTSNASGHRGRYQYSDSTWKNYKGYRRASDAPPSVQDERAQADIDKGWGQIMSNWSASARCWR